MADALDAAPEVTWETVKRLEQNSRALRTLAALGNVVGFTNVIHPENFRAVMTGSIMAMTRRLQARRAELPSAVDVVNIVRNPLPYYAIDDYFEGIFEGVVAGVKGLDPRTLLHAAAKLPDAIARLGDKAMAGQFFQLGWDSGEKFADEAIQAARDPEARARRMGYFAGLLIFEVIFAKAVGLAVKGARGVAGMVARSLERSTAGRRAASEQRVLARATEERLGHSGAPEQARAVSQADRATAPPPERPLPPAKPLIEKPPKRKETPTNWWERKGPPRTAGTRLKAALDKLRAHGVNVDDPYTLTHLDEIYAKYDDPLSKLSAARADIGELRILIMQAKRPGVRRVRFLEPSRVKRTPDIEVAFLDGTTEFVEVRTMTEAPVWATISSKGRFVKSRSWHEWAVKDIRAKIDHGQISSKHPGALVVHAPFQRASEASLEGWSDVLHNLRAKKPFPSGLRRIEISTPAQTNIYEPPNWTGRIVTTP